MSNQFSFGNTGGSTSAPSQGLFSTSGTPATSSLFSQPTPTTSASGGSLFSGAATGTSLFGPGSTGGGTSFGVNTGSKPGSGASTPSLFGTNASTGDTPAGGQFGQGTPSTSSAGTTGNLFSGAGAGATFGGGFNFGAKKDESSTPASGNKPATTQTGGLFSGTSGGNMFGTSTPSSSSAVPAGLSTPAAPKFQFNSTTPAGPPPAENGQTKPMFGSASAGQPSLFGAVKPADSTQPKPSLFSNLNAATTSSTPVGGLFSNLSSTPASSGVNTASTTAPASEAPKPAFSFTPAASTPATQAPTTSTAPTANAAPSLFGAAKSAPPATSSLFANLGGGATTTTPPTSTSTSSAPAVKPLFGMGTSTPAVSSANPGSTAPAAANPLGQTPASSTTQPASTSGTAAAATGTASAQQAAGGQPLGASTAGPTPLQSRLKNKTMDEIITRWASDLLKYQKDFQEQAAKVATWDRLLVENGEKIQTLSDSTHEAERTTKEIESQLSTVEDQQAELTSWLDRYEQDVDEMFARQVGPGENLQGPDQERERTYKVAEKLTDRLDDMGKNISSMIDAINDASANISKNNKADDPLSHIVRVLNSHLSQLQWIDQNTEVLQAKVAAAQKLGQSFSSNGYGGGMENDAAESFYRSYTGRR